MGALNSMPLWRGRRPMDRDGYWEEGGVEAISGALLAYPVLRQTLFFVSKFSIILLSVFLIFLWREGGDVMLYKKKINTSTSFVCFSVFLVFDTPLFQTMWQLRPGFVWKRPRHSFFVDDISPSSLCILIISLYDHLSLPYLATSNSSRKNLQNFWTRFEREVTNW